METERRVDPDCVNASNPFHVCADYCAQRARGLMSGSTGTKLAHKGGKRSEGIVFANRNVDPSCPNASNPFHQCADYCSRRNFTEKRNYKVKRSGLFPFHLRKWILNSMRNSAQSRGSQKKLQATVFVGRNVDPSCPNASNPFHECAEYCNKKKADARTDNKKKPEYCIRKSKEIRHEKESKSVVAQNMEKHKEHLEPAIAERNTDPSCPYSSNPYPSRQSGEKISVVKNAGIYEEEGEIIVVVDDVNPSSQYTSNSYMPSILSTNDRFKLSDKIG